MKVLIVSHNCFSSSQSMGKTLASLFSTFKKEELMQLYFYPSIPNIDICGDYFRVTDNNILHSILHRKNCGRTIEQAEIKPGNTLFPNQEEREQYAGINRNSDLIRRFRDVAWAIGNWRTDELKEWLKNGNPDVVLYALGDATFSQNIAIWASDFLNIPLVTYVCDEFCFFYKNHTKLFTRVISAPLVKGTKKTLIHSKHCISICDELGQLYNKRYNLPYTTIMTGSPFEARLLTVTAESSAISYIGNTALNRYKPLEEIAEAVSEINKEEGTAFTFTYYGGHSSVLEHNKEVRYGGWLSADQVRETIAVSRLLIHVETFDEEYRERLRYSISTKIADSLASGVPLFAYGPDDIASIQHLVRNRCAFVATRREDVKSELKKALMHDHKGVIDAALKAADIFHDTRKNSELMRSIMESVTSK